MFKELLRFELNSQLRKPPVYICFFALLLFTAGSFATGAMPLTEKEHINAPYSIALWCAVMSMLVSVAGSWIMGMPLYRDIEHRTAAYYLAYPITPAGFFLGRFFGALSVMLILAAAVPLGGYAGSLIGRVAGWKDPAQYGDDLLSFYLYPWLNITLPGIFCSAALFYALMAFTRNVKVIYSGGILLFLGYFLAFFFLMNDNSSTVVELADPFLINGVLLRSDRATSLMKNQELVIITGNLLVNRLLWTLVGIALLLSAYRQFRFVDYFSVKGRTVNGQAHPDAKQTAIPVVRLNFSTPSAFFSLLKTEWLNLVRDRYFWIMLGSGICFLLFAFLTGVSNFGVPEQPRTVLLYNIFNDSFPFYLFLFMLFYTGEVLHRERAAGFTGINDALPPGTWAFHGAKLCSLLLLGLGMALLPAFTALLVQLIKGFHQFNWPVYLTEVYILQLPRLLELTVFCYLIHVLVNHKFAAHGVAAVLWISMFFLRRSGVLDYNLLLYSYTPGGNQVSDMDGLGPVLWPILWFHGYWLTVAAMLVILAYLWYVRGTAGSFKERLVNVRQRTSPAVRRACIVFFLLALLTSGYIYYNVSYLNEYLTVAEQESRQMLYEKALKRYSKLPLPKVTSIILATDLYPLERKAITRAKVTLVNYCNQSIAEMLLDGDGLQRWAISVQGKPLNYAVPLYYQRGILDWFHAKQEASDFRLYRFRRPLQPGDSLQLEVRSVSGQQGFSNSIAGQSLLYNGTAFNGGLPGLGYDPGEELIDAFERKKHRLPSRKEEVIPQNDPAGYTALRSGPTAYVYRLDATISTSADQTAIAPGRLCKHWQAKGRNYFHYRLNQPGSYMPLAIMSARYVVRRSSVSLEKRIGIEVYYNAGHGANVPRMLSGLEDGVRVFSKAFGPYPFSTIRLAETSVYNGPITGYPTLIGFREDFGWNAAFDNPNQFDYCYYRAARAVAGQWWRFEVAANHTIGSVIIPEGLSNYSALMLLSQKYGPENMRDILRNQLSEYFFRRTRLEGPEQPLASIVAPYLDGKAGVVLYGLQNLVGADRLCAALRDFKNTYALRTKPPFPGSNHLYDFIQKHVPDSLQYYLRDNWQHITFYDNRMVAATASPTKNQDEYLLTLTVRCAKTQVDQERRERPVKMNDVVAIGVYSDPTTDQQGRRLNHPLFYRNFRLGSGQHVIRLLVKGKPVYTGIDPYGTLVDRNADDNLRQLTY